MTKEVAALAAEVATLTIEWMAEHYGLTFDQTVRAIATDANAQKRFTDLIKVAQKELGAAA